MFSKSSFYLLLLPFLLTACIGKIGEQPPDPKGYAFSGTQCVTETIPALTNFMQGTATQTQVEGTWDCYGAAISSFEKYIRGRSDNSYTPQELSTFFQDNFLDASKKQIISKDLQVQVMKLKQIFIGGSQDSMTRADLDNAISFFQKMKVLTVKLNPYMKVLTLHWALSPGNNIQADSQYFEDANAEVQDFSKNLAALVQLNHPAYTLSDSVLFLKDLGALYNQNWSFVAQMQKFMPVLEKVKKAIAGGDETSISGNEWQSFLLLGSRGYIQYLRFYYFIETDPQNSSSNKLSFITRELEDVFSLLQNLVSVKPGGVVSREEILELLQTFSTAWPALKVSDQLVLDFMKVKQLLIGGTLDSFTSNDFSTANLKVGHLKVVIERFLPYFSIYGMDWDRTGLSDAQAQKIFAEAQSNLNVTAGEVGALFETAFDLNNLNDLLHDIAVLYPNEIPDESALQQMFKKYIPLVSDIKNAVYGQKDSVIQKDQWSDFLGSGAKAYSEYLYAYYFLDGVKFHSSQGMAAFSTLLNQSLDLATDIVSLNKAKKISEANLNPIIARMASWGLLPTQFTGQMVEEIMDVVLDRVLVPPAQRLAGARPRGLNLQSVASLKTEVSIWNELEQYFDVLYPRGNETYSPERLRNLVSAKLNQGHLSPNLKTGLYEFSLIISGPIPTTIDSRGHLVISRLQPQSYTRSAVSQLNINRAVSRTLQNSYAMSLSRITQYQGVNLAEAQKAFTDFKPVAVKLGLIEQSNTTFASSRFREANIFVAHADGNDLMSFAEGADLVEMIWSGISVNSLLTKDLIRYCLNGARSTNGQTLVSIDCVTQVYAQRMPVYMTSLPDYVRYMNTVPAATWSLYLGNVLKAAGYVPNAQGLGHLSDIELAPHVIQYIEMIFAKYDTDGNGVLDTQEAIAAFPNFKGLIKQLAAGAVSDNNLLDVFTYILRYGKPPETILEKLDFALSWEGSPNSWNVQADRTQLSKILGYIADKTSQAQPLVTDLQKVR